jgi:Flp pilus assembly protein CpaB
MPVATESRSPNGTRSPSLSKRLAVEPPASSRRQRLPELAVGVLLVVGCALAALMLAAGDRDRTPVVALAGDVARGQVLTDADLSTVYVESDSAIAMTTSEDRDRLVGRAALSDLPAGALVTGEQLGDPVEILESGSGTVGLALEAGQLPSLALAPGDEVSVVAAGDPTSGRQPGEVVQRGTVVAIEEQTADGPQTGQRRWWIAIRAPQAEADDLGAVVAGGGRVQLVLVGRGE